MSCTHAKAPRLNVTTLLLTDIARLSVRRKGQMPQKQRLGTKHPGTGCERAPNAEAAPRPHLGSSHTQRYALRLRSSKGRIGSGDKTNVQKFERLNPRVGGVGYPVKRSEQGI